MGAMAEAGDSAISLTELIRSLSFQNDPSDFMHWSYEPSRKSRGLLSHVKVVAVPRKLAGQAQKKSDCQLSRGLHSKR